MTTSVLAATPTYAVRPVSWWRLGWVSWRRYRTSLLGSLALLAVVAVVLLIRGHLMRTAYAAVQACSPRDSAHCHFVFTTFHDVYGNLGLAGALLVWAPGVIGAFTGAPLLAREIETGTFRYTWTQAAGRMRWLVALLVPGALGVAVISAVLGRLIAWHDQPLIDSGIEPRLHTSVFPVTGLAVVGWGLAAYALGVFAGLVLRRVVPALVATLAVWTGLAFLAATLRNHYQAPLATSSLQLAGHDLAIKQWWTHDGSPASTAEINHVLQAIGLQTDGGGGFQGGPGSGVVDPIQYLTQHGFTQWTSYQPDSRYWPFQWIEFGWLAGLALILLGTTVWLVRRRAA